MRILLASPRGFCAGVHMAIASLELALESNGPPIYVYHEIVHNRHVVDRFRSQGVQFVSDLSTVPEGAILLFSAHGTSPAIRQAARQRHLRTIDATCPLVTKVHHEAIKYAKSGFTVVLIGHAGHDEVVGTMGEAPESIVLVESLADVDRIEVSDADKVAYLTQTTLSIDAAREIIARLRERFPKVIGPSKADICYATQNRQEAIAELSGEADLVLVLGSRNSSNSQRLAEIARQRGVTAHLIDGPQDIDSSWLMGVETVVVTAGASAPEIVVQECIAFLKTGFGASIEHRLFREENVSFPFPKMA
ncbi:MAG: 4-hydroxy-3-methylbut-2-enyl diphosphate reductase [Pirellulales bacterium]|nr:4-hydroxy-3-methylbut-2-enyl diphosphate reductase [Pirellulales bacterium]